MIPVGTKDTHNLKKQQYVVNRPQGLRYVLFVFGGHIPIKRYKHLLHLTYPYKKL